MTKRRLPLRSVVAFWGFVLANVVVIGLLILAHVHLDLSNTVVAIVELSFLATVGSFIYHKYVRKDDVYRD